MDMQLLEVQPNELKFICEVWKKSSCSIQLTNNTLDYVAFKVKTTNAKKFCVRPNKGIIKPLSICEVTTIMQAQKMDTPDMKCKDKFLIQSTIVPIETTVEDIDSTNLFGENGGNNIEERKLGTILVEPSTSPNVETLNNVGVSNKSNEKQIEELKLKINELDQKLHKAEIAISKLEGEKSRIQRTTKSQQKNCLVSCSIL